MPPKLWDGGQCWIVGGGPSIRTVFGIPEGHFTDLGGYFQPIHDKHIIGINNAYKLGDWIDILMFGDAKWYEAHYRALRNYSALIVTCSERLDRRFTGIKRILRDHDHRRGITTRQGCVSWNRNTGAAAINLAYHLGVKTVFLLGFDMDYDDQGYTHWFGSHAGDGQFSAVVPPFETHLKGFAQICADAKKLGLEILNVNLSSKIEEFPKVTLEQALKWEQ